MAAEGISMTILAKAELATNDVQTQVRRAEELLAGGGGKQCCRLKQIRPPRPGNSSAF